MSSGLLSLIVIPFADSVHMRKHLEQQQLRVHSGGHAGMCEEASPAHIRDRQQPRGWTATISISDRGSPPPYHEKRRKVASPPHTCKQTELHLKLTTRG